MFICKKNFKAISLLRGEIRNGGVTKLRVRIGSNFARNVDIFEFCQYFFNF